LNGYHSNINIGGVFGRSLNYLGVCPVHYKKRFLVENLFTVLGDEPLKVPNLECDAFCEQLEHTLQIIRKIQRNTTMRLIQFPIMGYLDI
jgi:hypothetical protein